jgi:hypothetical protein
MRKHYQITSSALVHAPAEVAYSVIADYREGHPHILPRKYFTYLEVERGGRGEGTVIRFGMRVLGTSRDFRAAVTEPEPGRVLVERNLEDGGSVSTFVVEPAGRHSRVTITTDLTAAPGLRGLAERLLTAALLPRIYARELEQLDSVAAERAGWAAAVAPAGA